MKCPHPDCGYKDGGDYDEAGVYAKTFGDKGPFYTTEIERPNDLCTDCVETITLFVCPSCGKAFIPVD